jgi:hypothetical protein
MTRPVKLDRLREISKQRRIRKPLPVAVGGGWTEPQPETASEKAEWPIPA